MLLNCGAGENSWESPERKEIKPVNPKGSQPCISVGRTDAEAPILWPPDVKTHWKRLMLGKIEGRRWRGQQKVRWLHGIINLIDMNLGKLCEIVKDREAWHAADHGVATSWTWLKEWTKTGTKYDCWVASGKSCSFLPSSSLNHSGFGVCAFLPCP